MAFHKIRRGRLSGDIKLFIPPPCPAKLFIPPPLFQNPNYPEMAILAVIQDNSGWPAAGGKFWIIHSKFANNRLQNDQLQVYFHVMTCEGILKKSWGPAAPRSPHWRTPTQNSQESNPLRVGVISISDLRQVEYSNLVQPETGKNPTRSGLESRVGVDSNPEVSWGLDIQPGIP